MMAEALEGRKHIRFVAHVPIYIADGGALVRKTVRLVSRDISAGGICFETSRELPLDAASRVVISSLGDIPGPILILGRVAWRRPQPAGGRYLVGVEFTEFENVSRDRLLAEIEGWRA
jgi:c-di-GMP-binding flagellar brake protein YcgR